MKFIFNSIVVGRESMKIAYLGPKGTFSEEAAKIYIDSIVCENDNINFEEKMFCNIESVINAVNKGEADEGIVPLENSIEGSVTSTIDTLIFDDGLYIKCELVLKVSQNLMAKKGVELKDVEKIVSHLQGINQCRGHISPLEVPTIAVSSTAQAARMVSESEENIAAIATKRAAEVYGLNILKEDIQDDNLNSTRFVVISKNVTPLKKDLKTSIAFTLDDDNSPGSLYRVLDILNIYEINMIKIESRPAKTKLGTYVFYIDLIAADQTDLEDAIKMIKRKVSFFKFLGSYPSIS